MSDHHVHVSEIFKTMPRSLDESLDLVMPLIPTQGPIKEFIHHNTLHSFQHLSFGTAIAQNRWLTGARIDHMLSSPEARRWCDSLDSECSGMAVLKKGIRYHRGEQSGYAVDEDLLPIFIRLTASYYDQGLALWPHPSHNLSKESFWEATQGLTSSSLIPLVPFNRTRAKELLRLDAERAVLGALSMLCRPSEQTRYLAEFVSLLPGWAGFVREVELNPAQLTEHRQSRLVDWLAVGLVAEVGFLEKHAPQWISLGQERSVSASSCLKPPIIEVFEAAGSRLEKKLIEQEWRTYNAILEQTSMSQAAVHDLAMNKASIGDRSWQLISCIDDRNFSLRAFLEEEWPELQTFGAAGFFGVDTLIQDSGAAAPVKHCPAPVTPKHLLTVQRNKTDKGRWRIWEHETGNILRSWVAPQLMGIPSALKLIFGTVAPEWVERTRLHKDDLNVQIDPFYHGATSDQLKHGYTIDEAAARVGGLLRTIGITKKFADFVAVMGHGSSSSNNPYFAAYDCGACSGRPGALNALVFCAMANDQRVREGLSLKGLAIPASTKFVPFLHDTSTDTIIAVGGPEALKGLEADIARFAERFGRALSRNAQYRCRQFALSAPKLSPSGAARHVARRAVAWFEPRPEYNHATNLACIVGRRDLSKSLKSDHAIFLQSYDPDIDTDGALLTGVLGAVIPVCGGINLEYLFSRIDPEVYGAGSKLPHNVTGLNGVMTGIESDLRTGLPKQMTEIHRPLRLLIVVEQCCDVTLRCLERLPHLRSWVDQRWVWLVCQHPRSKEQSVYYQGTFVGKEAVYAV